jgi:PAS domain S-box-containing protein
MLKNIIFSFQTLSVFLAVLLALCAGILIIEICRSRKLKSEVKRHKQTADKAVKRQQELEDTLNHLNDFVFFHDLSGNFYEFNTTIGRESDYNPAELPEMNIRDLVPEPYKNQVDQYLERIGKNKKDSGYMRIANKDGRHIIMEYKCSLIYEQGGIPKGVRGIARSITEQYYTRKALEKSEKKYRNILNTIEDGYYEVDLKGRYQLLNRSVLKMLGYDWSELKGQNYKKLISPEDVQTVFKTFNYVFKTGKPVKTFNWRVLRKDGTICHTETSVSLSFDDNRQPAGFQGIVRDISERLENFKKTKQLEAQLRQAQKMESIGTLAGGIAHDFNNILFPIMGYTELTMQDLDPESTAFKNLEKVTSAARRAKALIQQILAFSRQHPEQDPEPIFVQPVIEETLKLIGNTIPASIEIRSDINRETGTVTINPAHLHQMLMNLCTNAYHAMENQETGLLKVSLKQAGSSFDRQKTNSGKTNFICITVSDTGCGISTEIAEKIFDPYFTTKSQDKGTGLGLSVTYGIVKAAGGTITVESEPGKGASFHVFLPENDIKAAELHAKKSAPALAGGREKILLVDDESHVLEIEQSFLESLGYRVDAFTSSTNALDYFRAGPQNFDLVITDQSMPRLSGLELIAHIRKINPHIPVIMCTGYSEKITSEIIKQHKITAMLLKPLAKKDLAETVRKILDLPGQMQVKDRIS